MAYCFLRHMVRPETFSLARASRILMAYKLRPVSPTGTKLEFLLGVAQL